MSTALFDPIKTMAKVTRRIIVVYSGGKDSAVTLDLCTKYFQEVYIFRMYYVLGLSFQIALTKWIKTKYKLDIIDIPHFVLSQFLRFGSFRKPDLSVPIVSVKEVYNYIRECAGCYWIAGGERAKDSIWRNAIIKQSGSIDEKRGRFYPVAWWSKKEIEAYIDRKSIKISPEGHILGHSFRSLMPNELEAIKTHYPNDYLKIQKWFPLVEASRIQGQFFKNKDEN